MNTKGAKGSQDDGGFQRYSAMSYENYKVLKLSGFENFWVSKLSKQDSHDKELKAIKL